MTVLLYFLPTEGKDITDDALKKETATLTRKQAAAVKKRVETLNATRRGKKKEKQLEKKADVRDVFSGDAADVTIDVSGFVVTYVLYL